MTIHKNDDRFDGPVRRSNAPIGSVSRFSGVSTGVVLDADWHVDVVDFGVVPDALKVVNSHTAPTTAGDGTEWEIDAVGAAPTLAVNVNTFPPHLAITTTAVDTQGYNAQRSVASSNARTSFNPATLDEFFMYMVVRFTDGNNNLATLQQNRFFFGFAAVTTTLFAAGTTNFVGINKRDGDGVLRLVADDAANGFNGAVAQAAGKDLSTGSRTGTPAANIWLSLGVQCVVINQAQDLGITHGFYDVGRRASFHQNRDETHMASMAMPGAVPNAAMAASFGFLAGEAVAKTLSVAKIITGGKYRLGQA